MKNVLIFLFFSLAICSSYAQQGIGTNNPEQSSILELKSTTKGFLMPRMTNTEINELSSSAIQGLMAYCTDCSPKGIYIFDSSTNTWATSVSTYNFSIRQVTANGRIWMARDLGASRSTTATDQVSYGDLYQWGRRTDEHEKWDSTVIAQLASNGSEQNNFVSDVANTGDWKSIPDATLWTGTLNFNNPCPIGYRLPTATELITDYSLINLHYAGYRDGQTGNLNDQDNYGTYWTSESGTYVKIAANGTPTTVTNSNKADGRCVRCIKQVN
jgi:hypothetical protein